MGCRLRSEATVEPVEHCRPRGREKFSDWDPLFLQLDSARDAADLMAGVTRAVASGHVSPGEAACGSRECDRWAF